MGAASPFFGATPMKFSHAFRSISRLLDAKASAVRNECLKDLHSPALEDPFADDYFTEIDEQPTTFRQFNHAMAQHFMPEVAVEPVSTNHLITRAAE